MALRKVLPALVLLAALTAGCAASSGDGSASVYVKDAPTDEFDEIHVVFTKVEVHAAGSGDDDQDDDVDADANVTGNATGASGNLTVGGNATADNDTDGSSAGWKVLFEDAAGVDVDLLNASGGRAAFLGEADLAAGKYTQIRIHVKSAYGVANGTQVPITVSSGTLKLNHPFTVQADAETRIVLDIDLDRSLKSQGNGGWRMTPVIGTVDAEQVEDAASGSDTETEGEIVTVE